MTFIKFIREQIENIRQRDPSLKSTVEIFFFPSFRALNTWYFTHKLYMKKHYGLARVLSLKCQSKTGIDIHPGAQIGKNCFIDHGAGVVIGETCIIGDNVTIYQGVTLGGTGKQTGKRHPTVQDGVIIGAGAKVIGNITLGKYAKIGAGAIIVKDVPAYTTMVSTPAHPVKVRDKKLPVLNLKTLQHEMNRHVYQLKLDELRLQHRLDAMEKKENTQILH